MSCDRYRDAISARNDGEAPGLSDADIDAHLSTCASCRDFDASTAVLRRRLAVLDATGVPDVSREVVRRSAALDRSTSATVARWLLGAVAVQLVVLAVPEFLSDGHDSHSLSHLGAFRLAYAIGLLAVVVRPARARTMLHVAVVLVAALTATALVDVLRGTVPLLHEAVHLLGLASAVLLWVLARPRPLRAAAVPGPGGGDRQGPALRPVPDADGEGPLVRHPTD